MRSNQLSYSPFELDGLEPSTSLLAGEVSVIYAKHETNLKLFKIKKQVIFAIANANRFCYYTGMKKQMILSYLGNAPEIARKLDYAHRNVVYGWPDILTERIYADVKRRMKAARIPIPKNWK